MTVRQLIEKLQLLEQLYKCSDIEVIIYDKNVVSRDEMPKIENLSIFGDHRYVCIDSPT